MTDKRRAELVERWGQEVAPPDYERHAEWRADLPPDEKAWVCRLDEMQSAWGAETNDPDSEEWRDDLTPEEREVVKSWDDAFEPAYAKLYEDVVQLSRRNGRRSL